MKSGSALEQAAAHLKNSRRPCVLTGSGVSKESGIPTYRDGLDGLWAQYDLTELANPQAFDRNPKLVWDFYEMRREKMRQSQPNPGHDALAQLENRFAKLPIITQNVDDLHERAGSTKVIHLHGTLAHSRCSRNCRGMPTMIDLTQLTWDREKGPPACPHCGAPVRPNVVWFGEYLPESALQQATAALNKADVALVIGTSGMVAPASHMPYQAKRAGAVVIEINPHKSEITSLADIWIQAPSGEALPELLKQMGNA